MRTANDGDPDAGRISCDSPLGGALIGRRAGEYINLDAPGGRRKLAILQVE